MVKRGIVGAGIFWIIIAIIGYIFPINNLGWTAPGVDELCSSSWGQLGRAFSGDLQQICSQYKIITLGIYGSGILGVILIISGAIIHGKSKEKSLICAYCNFVAMSETELLKHSSDNHLDKSPYKCGHCDFIGITEEILWNHYNDKHPSEKKW